MTWKIAACSAIGTRHIKEGTGCQDYGKVACDSTISFGAISDGAGSASQSEHGAAIAVDRTLQYLQSWSGRLRSKSQLPSEESVRDFCVLTLSHVRNELEREAGISEKPLQEFACTLIAWMATPEWMIAMQVGDGFLVVRRATDQQYRSVFLPDKGEHINETTFVTSSIAIERLQVRLLGSPIDFVCAASDGLERVAMRLADWTPHPPFFKPFEDFIRETPDPSNDSYLSDFLTSDRLNARTDDDKTMALALYLRDSGGGSNGIDAQV